MTSPDGRIEIPVEPDLRGFAARLRAGLQAAANGASADLGKALGKDIDRELSRSVSSVNRSTTSVVAAQKRIQTAQSTTLDLARKFAAASAASADSAVGDNRRLAGAVEGTTATYVRSAAALRAKLGLQQQDSAAADRSAAANSKAAQSAAVLARAALDTEQVATRARVAVREVGPAFQQEGQDAGGKLAQGVNQGLIRNSPLIVAGIGAALAAGAPVAIAGATALFAGIGVVAAAQSQRVQNAWMGAWEQISAGTQADAAVMQDSLVRMASTVATGFQQLRPELQSIFESAGPLLEQFTNSLMQAAQNAMPGLVNAVQKAGPVFDGLGSLVESIGTGLSGFFDAISQHSAAAGTAFAAIGRVVGALLPILGELLGTGAELAAQVLPPLASVLETVAGALSAIAPILPAVAMGFTAFKVVSALTGPMESLAGGLTRFAQNAAFASYQGGAFGKAAGVMSTATSGVSSAVSKVAAGLPILGTILGGVGVMMERADEQATQWAQALLEGGAAAETARAQMSDFFTAMETTNTGIGGFVANLGGFGTTAASTALALGEVDDKQKELLASMTPLEKAQQAAAAAQADYNAKVGQFGVHSLQANEALQKLGAANAEVATQQRILDDATSAASAALADAATEMERQQTAADNLKDALDRLNGEQMSLADAEIAYQQSLGDAAEQIDNIRKGTEGYAKTLDISTQAGRDNKQMLLDLAGSTADVAQAYYDATGDYGGFVSRLQDGRQALIDDAMAMGASREEAEALADSVLRIPTEFDVKGELNSDEVQAQVQQVLDLLKQAEVGTTINLGLLDNGTVDQLKALGVDLYTLDGKTWMVRVTADDRATGVIDQILADMGLINGTPVNVNVEAPGTATAQGALDDVYNTLREMLGLPPIEPQIGLPGLPPVNTDLNGFADTLDKVAQKQAMPSVGLDDQATPKLGSIWDGINVLGGARPTPVASINAGPLAAGVGDSLGKLATLGAQRPTPTPGLNDGGMKGAIKAAMGSLQLLGAQRPTPTPGLNDGGMKGAIKSAMVAVNQLGALRPTPTATLIDRASGVARSIAGAIAAIQSKTVTITTVNRTVNTSATALASGGYISGPGTSTSDSIPILASNGEYMVRAASTARIGRAGMDAVNSGDWSAAAARFNELAQQQARATLASVTAAREAGRYAAGGYVDRGTAAVQTGPQRVTYMTNNLNAAPSLPTADQLQRMIRESEVLAGA